MEKIIYVAIGVAANELTHYLNRKFDLTGKVINWWNKTEKVKCEDENGKKVDAEMVPEGA